MQANQKIMHQHTDESIQKLCKVQFESANRLPITIGYGICALMLVFAAQISQNNTPIAILLMLIGCWIITAISQTPSRNARKITKYYDGNYPDICYTFTKDHILASFPKQTDTLRYKDIDRLIEDTSYCFLLMNNKAVYMFTKDESPECEAIKAHLEDVTSKKWSNKFGMNRSILSMILKK